MLLFFKSSNGSMFSLPDVNYARDSVNLETQIFPALCSTKKLYLYKTENMWSSIKSAGSAIYANQLYLELYKKTHPNRLAKNGDGLPKIIGNVYIHPSASVDPTAEVNETFAFFLREILIQKKTSKKKQDWPERVDRFRRYCGPGCAHTWLDCPREYSATKPLMHSVRHHRLELSNRLVGAHRRHALRSRSKQAVCQDRPSRLVHKGQAKPVYHHNRLECNHTLRVPSSQFHNSAAQRIESMLQERDSSMIITI